MKKLISAAVIAAMLLPCAVMTVNVSAAATKKNTETISYTYDAGRWKTRTREMEKLGRGLVAIKTNEGVYLSWRLLDSEDNRFGSASNNVSFDIYKNGSKIHTESNTTNYLDTAGTINDTYFVTIAGAPSLNKVNSISEGAINVSVATASATVYAVKYSGGAAEKTAVFEVNTPGTYEYTTTGFTADRVYIWDGMKPVENEGPSSEAVSVQGNAHFDIPLQKPDGVTLPDGESYSYTANDASCADLDGDGEYEIILKWDCNGKDNSQAGYTGNVLIDAYKMDGTRLWRVDLGKNIRAGAHYTQFLVYDFDGDGKAEMTCKTAPGSKDSKGAYVTAASHDNEIKGISTQINETDYRNANGYVLSGDEYLTVFDGLTGEAIDTIYYPNQRVETHVWGDRHKNGQGEPEAGGNRVDRFTATVAYMDGVKPYAVYMRGYYMRQSGGDSERQAACAVSFDGRKLECTRSFDTYNVNSYNDSRYGGKAGSDSYRADGSYKGVDGYKSGNEKFVGNGNHNCSTADVDGDGKDEVMTGALCYEFKDDGSLAPKWCTFMEHGDALHIGDYDPTHEGFEFFTVHEDGGPNTKSGTEVPIGFGMSVIDPDTGDIIQHWTAPKDTGRGIMADVGAGGYYQVKAHADSGGGDVGPYKKTANGFEQFSTSMSLNFRIFWDGDLYDELLDGTGITNWNGSGMSPEFTATDCVQINGTKANPALQADLFGDWREEVVYPLSDSSALRVFSTTTPTEYKIKTLMHDPVYRMGVTAEQTAYNQPPHVGMYLADEMFKAPVSGIEVASLPAKTVYALGERLDTAGLVVRATRTDNSQDNVETYKLTGFDSSQPGTKTITVEYKGQITAFNVTIKSVTGISAVPLRTAYAVGQELVSADIAVTVTYDDRTTDLLPSGYEISGFNSTSTGQKTVTVSYAGFTDSFTVEVKKPDISLLDGTYVTTSTSKGADVTAINIGEHSGAFVISHTITINSMPADGVDEKDPSAGFYVRFDPEGYTGAGWYLKANGDEADIYWTNGDRAGNAKKVTTRSTLTPDQTYTITYSFTDIAQGGYDARAAMIIRDENNSIVGTLNDLSLRNMSWARNTSDLSLSSPLQYIKIYNQAKSGQTSSVTISNSTIDE